MPAILGALPGALIAARNGLSANAFDRQLRELGMGARRSEVLQLYKYAVGIVRKNPDQPFRDIRTVPSSADLTPWPTKKATGIRQTVTLVYRDRVTGTINTTFWATTSPEGIRRETAMATAINAYAEHADRYGQDLIGAVHTGAHQYVPFS